MQLFTSMSAAPLSAEMNGRHICQAGSHIGENTVHQSCVQHKQIGHTVLTTLDLKYVHVTCLIRGLFLGIDYSLKVMLLLI